MGGASAWGIRSLADTFLRYYQPGLVCYLRRQAQVNQPNDYSALGFLPSVTGGPSGFKDIVVDPPPDVQEVSLHNIGILGGKLYFGARIFLISNLFVLNQMAAYKYTDPYQVFRAPEVLGLFYNHKLFSMASITHEDIGSETTLWKVIGNSSELDAPGS